MPQSGESARALQSGESADNAEELIKVMQVGENKSRQSYKEHLYLFTIMK